MPDVSNQYATYQAPVEVNRGYATLYLLLNGMTPITDVMVVGILKQFLKTNFDTSSLPHIYTTIVPTVPYTDVNPDPPIYTSEITSGPWARRFTSNGNRLVAIKWVLKYLGGSEVPTSVLQDFKTTYRNKIAPIISKNINMDSLDLAFAPYGEPLRGDTGFPLTPPLYTITPRRRVIAPTPSPTPEPYIKPVIDIPHPEPKTLNNAWLWVLGIGGTLYMLRRSW